MNEQQVQINSSGKEKGKKQDYAVAITSQDNQQTTK